MSSGLIEEIKKAEKKASEMISEAEKKAISKKEELVVNHKKNLQEIEESHLARIKILRQQVLEKSEGKKQEIHNHTLNEITKIKILTEKNQKAALEYLFKQLIT